MVGGRLKKDIMVIGASAGGLAVLTELVAGLPEVLQASVFIVLHVGASDPGILAHILQARSKLPVTEAQDGEGIRKGHIYVARPDYHLLVPSVSSRRISSLGGEPRRCGRVDRRCAR